MAPALLQQLNTEWSSLGCSPVTHWHSEIPELVSCIDADDVLSLIPSFSDVILAGLVRLAQAGDELAHRTVLQAMLPKLVLMSVRGIARSQEAPFDDLVASMCARIQLHPLHRESSTAGNLALDTLKDAQRLWRSTPDAEVCLMTEDLEHFAHQTRGPESTTDAREELAQVLTVSHQQGWINDSMQSLLWSVYGAGRPSEEVAHDLGCKPATVRSRCRNGAASLKSHRSGLRELI